MAKKDKRQIGICFGDFEGLFGAETAQMAGTAQVEAPAVAEETSMTIEEIIEREREERAKLEENTTFKSYKVSYLRKLFDQMTANLPNWKAPFTVGNLMGEEVMGVVAAIGYFTGDRDPDVVVNTKTMRYTVLTKGYYEATGGC